MKGMDIHMKVLGISFTHDRKKSCTTDFFVKKALEASAKEGAATEFLKIIDYNILQCTGCGRCINNEQCALFDIRKDQGKEVYKKIYEADAFIFGFPVYALHPPACMVNWFGRAPYLAEEDLSYSQYNYDQCKIVKGKCYKGKVAGLIAVATGIGHEVALGSLFPAFTAINLTVVASAGISLLEYDTSETVKKHVWAKSRNNAEFAIKMVQGVGERVVTGTSAFSKSSESISKKIEKRKSMISKIDWGRFELLNSNDEVMNETQLKSKKQVWIISRGPNASEECNKWQDALVECNQFNEYQFVRIAAVDTSKLPSFITKDFIKAQTVAFNTFDKGILAYNWDGSISKYLSIDDGNFEPSVVIINENDKILFHCRAKYSKEELGDLLHTNSNKQKSLHGELN